MVDPISIGISIAAFIISIVGVVQKRSEAKRAVRQQLSDIVAKITANFLETDKIRSELGTTIDLNAEHRIKVLNDQKLLLARQAEFLFSEAIDAVTDIEYATVARAFDVVDEYNLSQRYWKAAIRVAKDSRYKAWNQRSYARSLFRQGNITSGREQFEHCLRSLEGNAIHQIKDRVDTYQRWAREEIDAGDIEQAQRLLGIGEEELNKVTNAARKKATLAHHHALSTILLSNKDRRIEKSDAQTQDDLPIQAIH